MGKSSVKIGYTIQQACEATGIGRTKMYEYIHDGLVKPKKSGRNNIFTHDELVRLINSLPDSGRAA